MPRTRQSSPLQKGTDIKEWKFYKSFINNYRQTRSWPLSWTYSITFCPLFLWCVCVCVFLMFYALGAIVWHTIGQLLKLYIQILTLSSYCKINVLIRLESSATSSAWFRGQAAIHRTKRLALLKHWILIGSCDLIWPIAKTCRTA